MELKWKTLALVLRKLGNSSHDLKELHCVELWHQLWKLWLEK